MDLETVKILTSLGVPMLILAAVAFALWQFARWAGPKVDKVVDNHLKLIDTLNEHLPKQTDGVNTLIQVEGLQTDALNNLTKRLDGRTDLFDKIIDNQRAIIQTQDRIASKLPPGPQNGGKP